jgi:hypothetical protein
MLIDASHDRTLGALQERLRQAPTITPELVGEVVAQARERFQSCHPDAKEKVERLFVSGAWVDATLALLELELPQWRLRRLICEDGEWHCSLSRQPGLPSELDDMAEAVHGTLPLAILSALVEARRMSPAVDAARPRTVAQHRLASGHAICCDNFS